MTQPELTAWIQKAQEGDSQAQEALILEIQDQGYYHCKKMMKNESDAQDALRTCSSRFSPAWISSGSPPLFMAGSTIAANRCRHLLSRSSRELQFAEDEDGGSMLDDLEDLD